MTKEVDLTLNKAIRIWETDAQVKEKAKQMETSGTAKVECKGTDRFPDENKLDYTFAEKKFVSKRSYFRCGFTNHIIKDYRIPSNVVCRNCGKKRSHASSL